ncbi:23S rRNA (pseudouridine(1915)-N(3))-methyltransferase RlmH [Rhodoplanes elegans]|uniref:Ribosomal RNA large subunit methyltransferase H n=1 Tax=Rhodoplanes elegans TaxID=29408 RepID=A0A327KM00_9BRAD|nr:23S rRNA (pseudouridine(1915)-N(3))-methyltransferase RlmH [Rhodoplanes elegans]MBK5959920.1 23S rRNA (pseudouridine(1915)-N(3))-methyltransferase RlmH [Rhodoplanes elegans]RAI39819.1 23S rRNA (pseudouridine(1915)-N(3))-methyltransferase RlmH [Rhodoplanes elegans]
MRLVVAAVGRMKAGAERELGDRYLDRLAKSGRAIGLRDVEIVEIRESKAQETDRRRLEEAIALANVIPDGAVTVALDERGRNLDSQAFAGEIRTWRDTGREAAVFVIGGADGLGEEIRRRADLVLSFGAATWPHQLVRVMLLEQLYRAVTILSGHPYHRG